MGTDKRSAPSTQIPSEQRTTDVRGLVGILARKWRLDTLDHLRREGTLRFNELKRQLGTTSKVLTDVLTDLTDAELVDRTVLSEAPPHVEYALSDAGEEMHDLLTRMDSWVQQHDEGSTPTVLVVDTAVRTNELYAEWLRTEYNIEQIPYATDFDTAQLDRADVVLYHHHPFSGQRDEMVDYLRSGSVDAAVVLITSQRQSLLDEQVPQEQLIEPVLRGELRQAISSVVETDGE